MNPAGPRPAVELARLDSFARDYLETWDHLGNVRRRARYVIPAACDDEVLPVFRHPLLSEPEIVVLPPEAHRFLRAQSLYMFKNELALLETDVSGPLAAALANRHRRIELPRATCQVALTIDVDERYHALRERDYLEQAAEILGIPPSILGDRPIACDAVERVRAAVHPDYRVDLDVVLICLIENAITLELFDLQKDSAPTSPFYIAMAEHLADEGRHSAFFRLLLAYYWPRLEEEERVAVAMALPIFLDSYFGPHPVAIACVATWLCEVGFEASVAQRLARESYRPPEPEKNKLWGNMREVMIRTGVLDHAPTQEALKVAGWI
jgi:hypothetical protein